MSLTPIEVRTFDTYWKHSGASDNPGDNYRAFTPDNADPTGYKTKATNELKIAQWYSVIDNGVFKPNEIALDPDAFFIRVPGLSAPSSGSNPYRAKVWTDQDVGAEVELTPVAGQPASISPRVSASLAMMLTTGNPRQVVRMGYSTIRRSKSTLEAR